MTVLHHECDIYISELDAEARSQLDYKISSIDRLVWVERNSGFLEGREEDQDYLIFKLKLLRRDSVTTPG